VRRYASAVYAMALCPSNKPHLAQGLQFSDAKDLREIWLGHPLRGHQMQVGWVKIGDFRQIAGHVSKTVQDRCMVSIKVG